MSNIKNKQAAETLEQKYPGWTFQSFILPEGIKEAGKAVPWDSLTEAQKESASKRMMGNVSEFMSDYFSSSEKGDNLTSFLQACEKAAVIRAGA